MSNVISKLKYEGQELKTDYYVYLLKHEKLNRTYVGITNNLKRRLRQHNGEIKGGARSTTAYLKYGKWKIYGYIEGLSKYEALSRERIIHNMSKKRRGKGKTPLDKRLYIIEEVNEYNFIKL
jgi:structure-specific endonuclease subunit SLX1